MAYTRLNLANGTKLDEAHLKHIEDGIVNTTLVSMCPTIETGALNSSGEFSVIYYEKKYYRTPKYIRCIEPNIKLVVSLNCEIRTCQYDKNFILLNASDYISFTANTDTTIALQSNCEYVRFSIRDTTLTNIPKPILTLKNVFENEYFNIRPSDEGYQTLMIPVNETDVTCCDTETWTLQDDEKWYGDFGLLVLPETYSNIGKPTRLIIYAHGAGVHYSASTTRFPSTDCQPDYWLAQGYAVMDIDGYIYNDTTAHYYSPSARQAYENAYDWVIKNYNIYTDGVFLGGRSMGGGFCFEIMQSRIPVIAACPVAATTNPLWWYNKSSGTNRQLFAQNYKFEGTEPTWTSSVPCSTAEWEYLKNNFDKLLRYSPFFRNFSGLQDKEAFIEAHYNDPMGRENAELDALYEPLKLFPPAPVKFFNAYEDNTSILEKTAKYMYKMITNAGQICELRLFNTDTSDAHHFEIKDSRAMITVTTDYGKTMSAPLVYVEMLQFWRRHERI